MNSISPSRKPSSPSRKPSSSSLSQIQYLPDDIIYEICVKADNPTIENIMKINPNTKKLCKSILDGRNNYYDSLISRLDQLIYSVKDFCDKKTIQTKNSDCRIVLNGLFKTYIDIYKYIILYKNDIKQANIFLIIIKNELREFGKMGFPMKRYMNYIERVEKDPKLKIPSWFNE